jgi:hypothetical protein
MDSQPPIISSFIIRFVLNEGQDEQMLPSYRGSIRHIQSDEELHFHLWDDAVEFIRRYVPLAEGPGALPGKPTDSEGA